MHPQHSSPCARVRRHGPFAALLPIAALLLSLPAPAFAAGGDLDPTFGTGGTVLTAVNPLLQGWGNDTAVDASGRIVVAVTSSNYPAGTSRDFYVARYTPDGTLDGSFGTGGFARVGVTSAADAEYPYAVAVQPDGKIVVGGSAPIAKTSGVAVARLHPNGTLDTSFGTGGKILFAFVNKKNGSCFDIALQSDGRIMVVGPNDGLDFGFARLTQSGQLDATFGSGGKLVVATATRGLAPGGAKGVALQTINGEERILAAGTSPKTNTSTTQFALVRLRPNGALDTSFGSGGKVLTAFGGPGQQCEGLAVDSANNIVIAGRALPSDGQSWADFAVARYNASGALLAKITTNVSGLAGIGDAGSTASGVAVQATGEIVVAGEVGLSTGSNRNVAVVRYASDLSALDATFGDGGLVVTDFAGGYDAASGGVALQIVDGVEKIVVVGGAGGSALNYVALARYLE